MSCNALCLCPCLFPPSIFRHELTSSPSGRSKLTALFSINPSRTRTRRLAVSTHHTPTLTSRITGAMEDHDHRHRHVEDELVSFKHFIEQAKDLVRPDSSTSAPSPRWFSPLDCGPPLDNSPLLLFLPGIDGTGLGLIMHHKKLGKIFEVWCLHIPPKDRTPFTDLVKLIESTIRSEHHRSPNRPIYLVGESLGACLALSVAAFNPDIDLVLILASPATSFSRSQLQPILHLLQFIPDSPNLSLLHILSSMTGAMMDNLEKGIERLSPDLVAPSIAYLSVIADILPMETLAWKLQMISSASSYANSHLHAVKAQTLILSSGRDPLLPSHEEGPRLRWLLANCEICTFEDCGHFLFLEAAHDLVTVIKQLGVYRRSKERDFVSDYIPLSPSELKNVLDKHRWISTVMSPVILSTLEDGKIVRGFAGIPLEGPVVYVGYHMLLGFELFPLVTMFSEQKNIPLRGLAHPAMFMKLNQGWLPEHMFDDLKHAGAVPVSGKNFFKLLSTKSHFLLFPGGLREALHLKGEAYKLFWPERAEFVRMAARFGAKIVPFGTVGEDDFADVLFDYEDQMKIPFFKKYIDELSDKLAGKVRATSGGEVGNQALYLPGILPKFPGRFYHHFGKPIETEGRKEELRDKENAHELYLQVKSDVENCLAYLQEKRESDPYRSLVSRILYQAKNGFTAQVPTFDVD
ncbi:putative diacylglycerol acyltransferase, alpha/Beta hydrolase [Rosa chinensis]|uniref:Putative diacylglycerol acyltransferase, alpha/Beta hydrolase n=1 Tax=Rosa chinensis TaxID=74649 RepID=A0A2P6QK85_ROSCH|nr:acyltransferase-like protein At3g26840, chloroplastic [Rosa chinensis]PRQ34588.1 putative diacylglycerol acyltransferase, alpha/Beta hydrolase [Rosa chinensis]